MMDDIKDPSHFWRDMDLIRDLRERGDPVSLKAAERIGWLRENMIDPAEYMRVSNERGRLLAALCEKVEAA